MEIIANKTKQFFLSGRIFLILCIGLICTSCMLFELGFDPALYSGKPPDLGAPFIKSIIPGDGNFINRTLNQIKIEFSEPISNAEKIENYILSGPGVNTLNIASIEKLGEVEYILHLAGNPGTGEIFFEINNIFMDVSGNQLTGMKAFKYLSDGLTPEVLAINPPFGSLVGRNFPQINITYSEQVQDGDKIGNYSFTGLGRGTLAVAGITNPTGNTYHLRLNGMLDNGEVLLVINNIRDIAGNSLPRQEVNFTGDINLLNIQSVSLPDGSYLSDVVKQITITYSKDVVNGDAPENYTIGGAGAGTLKITYITRVNTGQYTLNLEGTPDNGAVSLQVSTGIKDNAGNMLTGQDTFNYQGDGVSPLITALDPPENSKIDDSFNQVNITFSEAMLNPDIAGNYTVSGPGTGSLAIASVVAAGGDQYRINFTGTAVNGRITLTMNLTDLAGNPLKNNTIGYVRDLAPPAIEDAQPVDNSNVKPADFLPSLVLNIRFTEYIIKASAESRVNYRISGPGLGTLRIVTVINNEPGDTKFVNLVLMGTPVTDTDIFIILSNLTDQDGNIMPATVITYHVIPD